MKFKLQSLAPLAVLVIILYLIWTYFKNLPATELTEGLIYAIPIALAIAFFSLIILIIMNRKEILKSFAEVKRKVWVALLIIFLISISLNAFVAPMTHRVYFDEDIYANIGQNILQEGKGILCNRGLPEGECFEYILNKQPMGHQFLYAVTFAIFGVNELPAHILTMLLGALSCVFLFTTAYLLTKRADIGLFAALMLALTPVLIRWSATMAAGTFLLFFSLMSMTFLLIYIKQNNQKTKTLLLAAVSFAYALQLRPEGYLLLIPAALALIFYDKNLWKKINKLSFVIPIAILFLLIMPTVIHTTAAINKDPWGTDNGKVFSTEYLNNNVSVNTSFFVENTRFPMIFTLLALLGGAIAILKKQYKFTILLATWFFAFFIIYGLFYAGSFNYGVDVRFSQTLYAPLLIFGAIGLYSIKNAIVKKLHINKNIVFAILAIILIVIWIPFYGYSSTIGEQARVARAQHDYAYEIQNEIPKNCLIMNHVPSMWLVMGYPSMQTWFGQNKPVMEWAFNQTDCIMFYEAYWCGSEPYKSTVCKSMHDNYNLELFKQKNLTDRNITLYRVYEK